MGSVTRETNYIENKKWAQSELSELFEKILERFGEDEERARVFVAQYTLGYMGVAYRPHVPQEI